MVTKKLMLLLSEDARRREWAARQAARDRVAASGLIASPNDFEFASVYRKLPALDGTVYDYCGSFDEGAYTDHRRVTREFDFSAGRRRIALFMGSALNEWGDWEPHIRVEVDGIPSDKRLDSAAQITDPAIRAAVVKAITDIRAMASRYHAGP